MVSATPILQRSLRRLALTTKQAGPNYYKGTGSGSMGRHTKFGGYIIEWAKVRTYICPDLTDFELTPFVTKRAEKPAGQYTKNAGPMDGAAYLRQWKRAGGKV